MPYQRQTVSVQPPIGGISRRTAFQTQPPFSSYDSVNFWPIDAKSGRLITGTRPRLQLQTTPSETPPRVNMITPINGYFTGQPFQSLVINCKDNLYWWTGSAWSAATGTKAGAVDQDRPIYAATFLSKTYIPVETNGMIVFDYDTGAAEQLVASVGTAPVDCRMAVVWQGSLVAAGSLSLGPHILFVSRTGDATDWDYTVSNDDIGGAFFTGGEDEGKLTGPITALIPQNAETLIVSTMDGLMALRGHPRRGGEYEPLSRQQTVLGQGAWCKTPDDVVYFLSKQGMYSLAPSPGSIPLALSRERVPRELIGLTYDYENPTVCMAYDSLWDMIYITVRDNNQNQAWLFDPKTSGFHRMIMGSYPFVLCEHIPFQTESASGVMFGRYDGLWRFDQFGNEEEEMSSSIIVGPMKIASNANEFAKVVSMRMIFGRNTPSSDAAGSITVCGGVDGQDAVSRLINGEAQYTASLETVKNNNGMLYPHVGGSAVVVAISQTAGDLALEEILMDVAPSGKTPHLRTTQFNITGTPSVTVDTTDFDSLSWEGYSEATPDNAPSTLSSFTHWIDLSELPTSWWAKVGPSGGDIRATDGSNSPLAADLIHFDAVNQTGFLAVKHHALTTAEKVRLWVGKSGMAQPQVDSTYGQYNAYDSDWYGFWPDGGGVDRTSLGNDLTHTNSTAGDSAGIIGVLSTDYDEANHGSSDSYAVKSSPGVTTGPCSLICVARQNDTTATAGRTCGLGTGTTDNRRLIFQRTSTEGRVTATEQNTGSASATTGASGIIATTFHHAAATFVSTTSRFAYVNGAGTENTTSVTAPDAGTFSFAVGRAENPALATTTFQGKVSLLQLHNSARSSDWVAYQAAMMDQTAFWNGWSEFVTVNAGAGEPDLDTDACPLGEVPVSETGTWSGYASASPDPVPTNAEGVTFMPNYTYFIDLSDMPANWWSAVKSDGTDIRVTDANNIFLPSDLIYFEYGSNLGLLAVRQYATSGTTPEFRVWVGNASAVTVSACAAYGRYRTYDQYYRGFWPTGAGVDRTQYQNDCTGFGDLISGGISGPNGGLATQYDGSTAYSKCTSDKLPTGPDLTLVVVAKPDLSKVSAPISIAQSSNQWYYGLHTVATTEPYTWVSYAAMIQWLANEKDFTSFSTWNAISVSYRANAEGGMSGRIVVDDTVNSVSAYNTQFISKLTDLDTFFLGATTRDSTEARIFYDGGLALASLHSAFRSTVWTTYLGLMLDQSSFWSTWTWTASSSALPQP